MSGPYEYIPMKLPPEVEAFLKPLADLAAAAKAGDPLAKLVHERIESATATALANFGERWLAESDELGPMVPPPRDTTAEG